MGEHEGKIAYEMGFRKGLRFGLQGSIPKADYEVRLKSDMIAMLTELQLEIEELDNPLDYDFEGYNQCAVDCEKIIQKKIDKLKED